MSTPNTEQGKLYQIKKIWDEANNHAEVDYSGTGDWIEKLEERMQLIDEAKAEIPQLEPVTIPYPTPTTDNNGKIITQKVDDIISKEIHRQTDINAAKYILECQRFFEKWLGSDATVPQKQHLNPESNNKQTGEQ